jgi:hypothetical protein
MLKQLLTEKAYLGFWVGQEPNLPLLTPLCCPPYDCKGGEPHTSTPHCMPLPSLNAAACQSLCQQLPMTSQQNRIFNNVPSLVTSRGEEPHTTTAAAAVLILVF